MSNETSIDLKQCVVDAVLSGLIALVVFGPIVGVVLDGYGFNLHYERVGWIIAIVMAGRFLLSLYLQTRGGRAVLERFEGAGSGVHVLPPGYKTRLRWIVPLILVALLLGAGLAWWSAGRVAITDMPQMVALYNGMGGGSAAAIGAGAMAAATTFF